MKPMFFAAALTVLAAGAVPLQAALPPCAADRMVEEAIDVVQLGDLVLTPAAAETMECHMSGTILAVLRGDMVIGDKLLVAFPCQPLEGMVGPQNFVSLERVADAPWAEVHLAKGEIAGYGAGLVLPTLAVAGNPKPAHVPEIGHMLYEPSPMCV